MKLHARAPGKVNLCLFLGPARSDGRHELVTVFESVSVADELTVTVAPGPGDPGSGPGDPGSGPGDPGSSSGPCAPGPGDQVVCAGVGGLNIVARTLDGLRSHGWDAPPVRVEIEKRIPVAGGMGGGSADAAAMLRIAPALAPVSEDVVSTLAASLGADVPSQLVPGVALGTGAGDVIERWPALPAHALVVVPQPFALSTAAVYRQSDRIGVFRDTGELTALRDALRDEGLAPGLLVNDLMPAAVSLAPEIGDALDAVRAAGAAEALVSGSGPTVFGLQWGPDAREWAAQAASALSDRYPEATVATPVSEDFGAPRGS